MEGFSLEDGLKWREVDDQELTNHRPTDSEEEDAVAHEPDREH